MPVKTSIHIALAFDQNFWAPAYATMRSICLSTRRRTDLVFHLCHTALKDFARTDLQRIEEEFGAALFYYEIDTDPDYLLLAETLPHERHIPAVMYARLMFGRILPKNVSRLIYVDCDIHVRHAIEELYEADLEGRPVGAVADPHSPRFSNGRDVNQDRDLLDPADPFFNSGLLLIDLDAWRKRDIVGELRRLDDQKLLGRFVNDQQLLNYLFKQNWTPIDSGWNTLAASRVIEALDPKAVHHTGRDKPWNVITRAPFARVYRHVMTNELYYRYMRYRWAKWWKGLAGL